MFKMGKNKQKMGNSQKNAQKSTSMSIFFGKKAFLQICSKGTKILEQCAEHLPTEAWMRRRNVRTCQSNTQTLGLMCGRPRTIMARKGVRQNRASHTEAMPTAFRPR